MTNNKIIIIAIVALLVGFGVGYLIHSNGATKVGTVSNFSEGQTETNTWGFANGASFGPLGISYFDKNGVFTSGGYVNATTSVGAAATLASADLIPYNSIAFTPNVSSITLTFPATSTLGTSFIPNTGDMAVKTILNATTTNGINITLAAGTGEAILVSTSTKAVNYLGSAVVTSVK